MKTVLGASLATTFARAQETAADPQRKIGWALVGLGSLSANQIAPALLKTTRSQLSPQWSPARRQRALNGAKPTGSARRRSMMMPASTASSRILRSMWCASSCFGGQRV
jgi:hypothetical protein